MAKRKPDFIEEFKPPEKKLISEGDLLIKKLVEKQKNTKTNLQKELAKEKVFEKSSVYIGITSFNEGQCSLKDFHTLDNHIINIEHLQSIGLDKEEIELYLDYQNGIDFVIGKHKNYERTLLLERMKGIIKRIEDYKEKKDSQKISKESRENFNQLAVKPDSTETKLLKFALNNELPKEKIPHPMDNIKEIAEKFNYGEKSEVCINQIRRKARKLANRLNDKNIKSNIQTNELPVIKNSKWDVKQLEEMKNISKETKTYTCKPMKMYTIKHGVFVEVDKKDEFIISNEKISIEEIKKIPKYENYEIGEPNKILYLKNLPNKINEIGLKMIFEKYINVSDISFKIMYGRMKGQAFVTFPDLLVAVEALNELNGIIVNGKPVIMQYGKKNS